MRRAVLIGALALLVAAPVAAAKTFDNPKGTITVAAHTKFTIALDATPGTGYSWQLARKPDPRIVKYLSSKTTSGGAPGAPGKQLLRFQARKPGTTPMILAYVGPGRDHPVGKRLPLTVKVK
jgi:predicted secreted protein